MHQKILFHNIMQPNPFLHKNNPDNRLHAVGELHEEIDPQDGKRRAFRQGKGEHYADTPDKYAVEKERDQRFAAGAERKIGGVKQRMLRDEQGGDHNQFYRQLFYLLRGFVKFRKHRGDAEHEYRDKAA